MVKKISFGKKIWLFLISYCLLLFMSINNLIILKLNY